MRKTVHVKLGPFGGMFLGLLFAVVGCFVAFWFGKPILDDAAASRDWPSVRGEITRSRVSKTRLNDKTTYSPDIEYRYQNEGRELVGNTVFFGDQIRNSNASSANRVVAKYPQGSKVDVYFDPAEPGNSVLEPGTSWQSYLVFGIGLIFLAVGVLVFGGTLFYFLMAGALLGGVAAAWFRSSSRAGLTSRSPPASPAMSAMPKPSAGSPPPAKTAPPPRRADAAKSGEDDGFHFE